MPRHGETGCDDAGTSDWRNKPPKLAVSIGGEGGAALFYRGFDSPGMAGRLFRSGLCFCAGPAPADACGASSKMEQSICATQESETRDD